MLAGFRRGSYPAFFRIITVINVEETQDMYTTVTNVMPDSPASKSIISPGDTLMRINGNKINDVLDYRFHSYDSELLIELKTNDGRIKLISVKKQEGADLGLEFASPLMDKEQSCRNKCIFCFIDQLPKGMRKTLYHKDDDVRQSLLDGNYVTLTNLSTKDIDRLIKLHVSPINVSVHTMNPKLRSFMLGRQLKDEPEYDPIDHLKRLAMNRITLNCQIVCCPGINDGEELKRTIEGLIELGMSVNSVSVVPVGLTKFREKLYKLTRFDKASSQSVIKLVEEYGKRCVEERGSRVFYCSDEFYITAKVKIPPNEFFEEYPQLSNGVGMMRLFVTQFIDELNRFANNFNVRANEMKKSKERKLSIATGTSAAPYLKKLINVAMKKYDKATKTKIFQNCTIFSVKNDFFGDSVTISGLVTGNDLIKQLKEKNLGSQLLIPQNMLKYGENIFLDDVTVDDVSRALNVPVRVVPVDGKEFFRAIIE